MYVVVTSTLSVVLLSIYSKNLNILLLVQLGGLIDVKFYDPLGSRMIFVESLKNTPDDPLERE